MQIIATKINLDPLMDPKKWNFPTIPRFPSVVMGVILDGGGFHVLDPLGRVWETGSIHNKAICRAMCMLCIVVILWHTH